MPELAQQLTEACGPGMPGPYWVFKIGGELSEACGPGMPGPYWLVKGKQSATGRGRRGQDPSLRCKPGKCAMQKE